MKLVPPSLAEGGFWKTQKKRALVVSLSWLLENIPEILSESFSESLRETSPLLAGGCTGVEVMMCEEGGCEGVPLTDSNVSSVYPARTRLVVATLRGEGAPSLVAEGEWFSSEISSAMEDEVCPETSGV